MAKLDARLQKRIDRYHRLYASDKPGVLIVNRPSWPIKKNLFEYDYNRDGHLLQAADVLAGAKRLLEMNGDLDDDFIPYVSPDLGIAIHHTFVIDRPVQFAEWTSWAQHPLEGTDGYRRLDEVRYSRDNRWVKLIREMHQYYAQHDEGLALPLTFGHYSPLDLANALRGNELLYDFYDYPEQVHDLLSRCTQCIIELEEDLRDIIGPSITDHGLPFWGAMGPRNSVFISEDLMDMCGPEIGRQWGLPYSTKIRQRFGSISVHHHMLGGAKVQRVVADEVDRALIQISNDPNMPPAEKCLRELQQATGNNVLMFDAAPEDIEAHQDELRGMRAIVIMMSGNNDRTRRAIDMVRSASGE